MSLNPLRRGATQLGESVTNIPTQNYRTRRFGYELSPLDVQQNTRDPTYQRDRLTEMLGEVGSSRNPYFHRRNSYIAGKPLSEEFAYGLQGRPMLPPSSRNEGFQYSRAGSEYTPPTSERFQYNRQGKAQLPPTENYVQTRVKNYGNAAPLNAAEHYSVPSIIGEYDFPRLNEKENFGFGDRKLCKCDKGTDKILRLIVWLLLLLIFLKMFRS